MRITSKSNPNDKITIPNAALLTRLVSLLDYLLRNFDTPSEILLSVVQNNLLNINDFEFNEVYKIDLLRNAQSSQLKKLLPDRLSTNWLNSSTVFYSFANTDLYKTKPLSQSALNVLNAFEKYESLYKSLVNLLSVFSEPVYSDNSEQQFSLAHLFSILWSIIGPSAANDSNNKIQHSLPVSLGYLSNSLRNLFVFDANNDVESLNESYLTESNQNRKNFEILHLLGILNQINNRTHDGDLEAILKSSLNFLYDKNDQNVNLVKQMQFFEKFWSTKFEFLSDDIFLFKNDLLFDRLESNHELRNSLIQNSDLLYYHVNLVGQCFVKKDELSFKSANSFNAYFEIFVKLLKAYKVYFKQFLLLENLNLKTLFLSKKVHFLLLSSSQFSTKNSGESTQINCLNSSREINLYLLNLERSFAKSSDLDGHFKNMIESIQKYNSNLFDRKKLLNKLNNKTELNQKLINAQLSRSCFSLDLNVLNLIQSMLEQLNSSFNLIAADSELVTKIEDLFIDFNCDLNCFFYVSKQLSNFFDRSSNELSNKSSKFKFKSNVLSKISSLTYEAIFNIFTSLLTDSNKLAMNDKQILNQEAFLNQLLVYMEKSLENVVCLKGFCTYFKPSSDQDKNNDTNEIQQLKILDWLRLSPDNLDLFRTDKFTLFILSCSKLGSATSSEFYTSLLRLINKVFRLSYQFKQQQKSLNSKNITQDLTENIDSIVQQILSFMSDNHKEENMSQLMHSILSSLDQTASSSINSLKLKLELRQMIIYLNVNEEDVLTSTTSPSLSLLNILIQLVNSSKMEHKSLFKLMDLLASSKDCVLHLTLLNSCFNWLEKLIKNKLDMESVSLILSYIIDLFNQMSTTSEKQQQQKQHLDYNQVENKFNTNIITKQEIDDLIKIFDGQIVSSLFAPDETRKIIEKIQSLTRKEVKQTFKNKKTSVIAKQRVNSKNLKQVKTTNNRLFDFLSNDDSSDFSSENENEQQEDQNNDDDDEEDTTKIVDNNYFYDNNDTYDDEEEEEDEEEGDQLDNNIEIEEEDTFGDGGGREDYSNEDNNRNQNFDDTFHDQDDEYNDEDFDDDDDEDDDDDDDPEEGAPAVVTTSKSATNNNKNNQNNEYYEEIEEIEAHAVVTATKQSTLPIQISNTATDATSNQNFINDILYVVEDEYEDEEDDDEEDEEDEQDDEYGDEFGDNFVATSTYNNNNNNNDTNSNITTVSNLVSSSTNRDAIYRDLMSHITAAAAAFNEARVTTTSSTTTSTTTNRPPVATNPNDPKQSNDGDFDSKLCTYTITKKDFMNQHWYYCHTCKMVDRIGVCSICARVCHKGHDISYSKYGSFFCDCGAKEDGSCKALVKRRKQSLNNNNNCDQSQNKAVKDQKSVKKKVGNKSNSKNNNKNNNSKKLNSHRKSSTSSQQTAKENENSIIIRVADLIYCKLSTFDLMKKLDTQIRQNRQKCLQQTDLRAKILTLFRENNLYQILQDNLRDELVPQALKSYDNSLLNSTCNYARKESTKLRENLSTTTEKITSDLEQQTLFTVSLGSQEGAFENVRMTFTGDDGSQIRQLIQSHQLRRVSMCSILTNGPNNYLIITHEKGKSSHFTILQLNTLLKSQEGSSSGGGSSDSNKNKLTLTKLNTISVPFTLISCSSNQFNPNLLCLTGLKDCIIMSLNENMNENNNTETKTEVSAAAAPTSNTQPPNNSPGQQKSNNTKTIMLHPSLEGSNFIIKSMWLPGSKSELALITSEFIKIYDLSVDKLSPIYYFVLPIGKIKDVTFVNYQMQKNYDEKNKFMKVKHIVIMSSFGFMYSEEMNDSSSAKNGVYYVTNTIDVPSLSDTKQSSSSNNVFGGGISVYYSFKLQMLFWSYQQGKSYCGAFKSNTMVLNRVMPLNFSSNNSQALCNWNEVVSHPGIVIGMTLITNIPVAFMFTPDKISCQEIRLTNNQGGSTKAKILDIVALRHSFTTDQKEQQADGNISGKIFS